MKKIITDSFSGGLNTPCFEIKILGWSGSLKFMKNLDFAYKNTKPGQYTNSTSGTASRTPRPATSYWVKNVDRTFTAVCLHCTTCVLCSFESWFKSFEYFENHIEYLTA